MIGGVLLAMLPTFVALTLNQEITFGDILTTAGVVAAIAGAYWALRGRLDHIEDISRRHELRMDKQEERHSEQIDRQDGRINKLEEIARLQADTLQRLVGRIEAEDRWDRQDRRSAPRSPRG